VKLGTIELTQELEREYWLERRAYLQRLSKLADRGQYRLLAAELGERHDAARWEDSRRPSSATIAECEFWHDASYHSRSFARWAEPAIAACTRELRILAAESATV